MVIRFVASLLPLTQPYPCTSVCFARRSLAAASQATEETEDEETKERRRETEENVAMSEEEVKEKERVREIQRRADLKEAADASFPKFLATLNQTMATSPFLQESSLPTASVVSTAEALLSDYSEKDDMDGYYETVSVVCSMAALLARLSFRANRMSSASEAVTEKLLSSLNAMCTRRAKFETDSIVELAARIGDAASTGWKAELNFQMDLSKDERVCKDADFPGVVFDTRGERISIEFVQLLATRFKKVTKGNSTISYDSFLKVFQRVVGDGQGVSTWEWTDSKRLLTIGKLFDPNETGRIPWKKVIHSLVCHFLPSLPSIEELRDMAVGVKGDKGLPVFKKDGFWTVARGTFFNMRFWFEEGERAVTQDMGRKIKEVYATVFQDNESVEFTELLLAWSAVEGPDKGVGLLRGITSICGAADVELKPGGSGPMGPTVSLSELEGIISFDYSNPKGNLSYANSAFMAAGGEGDGKVSFSSLRKVVKGEWNALELVRVF